MAQRQSMTPEHQRLTSVQYQQLLRDWQNMPVQWNPDGVYGGIVEKPVGKPWLYFLPGVAALTLLFAIFLPWFVMRLFANEFSLNGIGWLAAPPGFVESVQKLQAQYGVSSTSTATPGTANNTGLVDGWVLLALTAFSIIFILTGLFTKSKFLAIPLLVAGIGITGVVGYDFLSLNGKISELGSSISDNPLASSVGSFQIGFGLYLALVAAIALIVTSIFTLAMFNQSNNF